MKIILLILISFSLTAFSQSSAVATARVGATIISIDDLVVDSSGNLVYDKSGNVIFKHVAAQNPTIQKAKEVKELEVVHLYAVRPDTVIMSKFRRRMLAFKYRVKKNHRYNNK